MSDQEPYPFISLKTKQTAVDPEALRRAAGSLLGTPVLRTEYKAQSLQGGTLGDVQLITGSAQTADGRELPFQIVMKTQKKWERPGDPNSWRREYDLCRTEFHTLFTETFRWPKCFGAEETEGENRLWMEYVKGVSGAELTLNDLALAALELGRFQARCHQQETTLRHIDCFSDFQYMQRDFAQWSSDTREYKYLRSDACELPQHLKQMLIATQEQSPAIFQAMSRLPRVLCHRDYWTENIFVSGGNVIAIDWDCAGWSAPGEDIASLVADETPAGQIGAYYRRLLPAYYTGIGESIKLPPMDELPIREMILFKFGYRLVQQLMFAENQASKDEAVLALEEIVAL
ncbi:MAG: aminoglycoside phosphotransferase family protein [Clostridiales bacterium]|nr:aminoglycoside phosphotransferase family protein [Clostridiales bacterium]